MNHFPPPPPGVFPPPPGVLPIPQMPRYFRVDHRFAELFSDEDKALARANLGITDAGNITWDKILGNPLDNLALRNLLNNITDNSDEINELKELIQQLMNAIPLTVSLEVTPEEILKTSLNTATITVKWKASKGTLQVNSVTCLLTVDGVIHNVATEGTRNFEITLDTDRTVTVELAVIQGNQTYKEQRLVRIKNLVFTSVSNKTTALEAIAENNLVNSTTVSITSNAYVYIFVPSSLSITLVLNNNSLLSILPLENYLIVTLSLGLYKCYRSISMLEPQTLNLTIYYD